MLFVALLPRMRLRIYLAQTGYAVVCVDLRRAKRCVTHKLLYVTHIGTRIQQVRGKRVTQHVRTLLALYAGTRQRRMYDVVHLRAGYSFALAS